MIYVLNKLNHSKRGFGFFMSYFRAFLFYLSNLKKYCLKHQRKSEYFNDHFKIDD